MESESNPYGKILQETFPGFSRKELANIAHSVKQKLDTETLSERFSYHIEQARQEGGKPGRLRELVMLFIDKCMINGFDPYALDLPEAFDDRTRFLATTIYEVYKTHWITPSRTDEAIKLESNAKHSFDKEAWNILKTLGELERTFFQKGKNIELDTNKTTIPTKGDGSTVITHSDGRVAIHTKDGAWIDLDFRSPEERLDPYANYLSSSRNVDCAPPPQTFKDKLIDFLIEAWPITRLLVIAILVLPLHGISLILDECTRLSDDECLECAGWITASFWLTVALGFILNKCLKKKGLSYKTLILSSIRALRRLLRRLEESTRP